MVPAALLRAASLLLCLSLSVAWAAPVVKIVTSTTDLQALTEAVGGNLVEIACLVLPGEDAESHEARPQDLQKLKNARLVVKVGVDFDLWFDQLLRQTGNRDLLRGGVGHVDASTGIALLDARAMALTAHAGHAHGAGNPHYWLDPINAETITGNIIEGLERIDPANSATYRANRNAFLARLRGKVGEWRQRLERANATRLIAYHDSWAYFARRFRLNIVDYIELKPGIPPSSAHLADLLRKMRDQKIVAVIKAPFENEQLPQMLATKTGARVLNLAPSVGAVAQASDYLALFEYNVGALASLSP